MLPGVVFYRLKNEMPNASSPLLLTCESCSPVIRKGSETTTGSSHVTTLLGEPDTRRARDATVTAQRAS